MFSKLLFAAGAAVLAVAVGWWWTTFGDVVAYGYPFWTDAGRCLVHDSDICMLAKVLCLGSHPRLLIAYWTSAFCLGFGILFHQSADAARPSRGALSQTNIKELTRP